MPEAGEKEAGQGDGFEVRMRWRGLPVVQTAILPVAVLAMVFWPVRGDDPFGGLVSGSVAVGSLAWYRVGRLRAMGCVLRIDAAGVTVAGEQTVPWGRLRRVELVRRGVVVFLPRIPEEGVLPLVPGGLRLGGARRRRRVRGELVDRYGSPMVLFVRSYGVRAQEVLDAVCVHSGGEPVSG